MPQDVSTMLQGILASAHVSDVCHVIGFSDLFDLWVIKIRKTMILCARSTSRPNEQMNKWTAARNVDQAARTRERFVYSIVKVTRVYDYQTWQTFCWEIHEVRKGMWAFLSWLYFSDADWLGGQAPITWWQSDVINGVGYKHSFIAFISHGVILIN